jgi:Zn-dependent protease with chaperone function
LARKSKVRKTKEVKKPKGLRPADFIFPGEKSSYWGGVIGVAIVFLWIAIMLYLFVPNAAGQRVWYRPLGVIAYPVLAILIANVLAAKPRQEQFKKGGRQGRVMHNNHAELHRALTREAGVLGMKTPPDMYLVDDPHPLMFSLPAGRGIIVASHALRNAVSPDEFEALIAHEVTHIACKHVRVDMAMTFIRHANIGLKIGLFPVLLMMLFARAWSDLIDFTADRGSLLIMLRPAVINAALVKFAVAVDPNAGISSDELQAFLDSQGDIATDSEQMERHFRIGQFMGTQPGLRERIEQLTEFPKTKQGQEAIAKAAELQGVAAPVFAGPAKHAEDAIETIAADEDEQGIPGAM